MHGKRPFPNSLAGPRNATCTKGEASLETPKTQVGQLTDQQRAATRKTELLKLQRNTIRMISWGDSSAPAGSIAWKHRRIGSITHPSIANCASGGQYHSSSSGRKAVFVVDSTLLYSTLVYTLSLLFSAEAIITLGPMAGQARHCAPPTPFLPTSNNLIYPPKGTASASSASRIASRHHSPSPLYLTRNFLSSHSW